MPRAIVLIDTGPLVAALTAADRAHEWAKEQFEALDGPFLTCEAVISEACYLLRSYRGAASVVLGMLESGALRLGMDLEKEAVAIRKLYDRYRSVPAALADVCLVRMSELYESCVVLTLDSDFHIYRRHGRRVIPTLCYGKP